MKYREKQQCRMRIVNPSLFILDWLLIRQPGEAKQMRNVMTVKNESRSLHV